MLDCSIRNIVSHISQFPLLEPNRFKVVITDPFNLLNEPILFNCHRCSIPAHSLGSFEHSVIGPKRKIPNEEIYDDLSISFYVNHHIDEMRAINDWINRIGGDTFSNQGSSWRISYYNDIVSDMEIGIYNLKGEKTTSVKIYEAYPIGVTELELSYGGDAPADITVNFAFHSYELLNEIG